MKYNRRELIRNAVFFYYSVFVVLFSLITIDTIIETSIWLFIFDVLYCALLITACYLGIDGKQWRKILLWDLYCKIMKFRNE